MLYYLDWRVLVYFLLSWVGEQPPPLGGTALRGPPPPLRGTGVSGRAPRPPTGPPAEPPPPPSPPPNREPRRAVAYLLVIPPRYSGPTRCEPLVPAALRAAVEGGNGAGGAVWVVGFQAAFSPQSLALEPAFAELSLRHAAGGVRFGTVDVGRCASLCCGCGCAVL